MVEQNVKMSNWYNPKNTEECKEPEEIDRERK